MYSDSIPPGVKRLPLPSTRLHPLKAMNLIDIADLFLRCRRVLEEPALAGSDHHPNTHPAHNHAFGRNHLLFGDECRNE
ncbi:hypothetical protein PZE06_20305 [Robertmurraya sp. DFI.2.37]|nr:hypothetical protein [Robertmurraya sp. DFI.2.37]